MEILDVMVDVETLSLRSDAAIIQIAAVPFYMDKSHAKVFSDFSVDVNPSSEAMYGFSFDASTIEWWSKNEPANEYFKEDHKAYSIKKALTDFTAQLTLWKDVASADELMIWCQCTDFDITVLRNAYRKVFGSEKDIPWNYRNVRDARTYFLEAARLFASDVENPYELIKTDDTQHLAINDCKWSIEAVQWAYDKYNNN